MSEEYRISLGIGLDTDDFSDIKKKINSLEDNPIKLRVDAETTELTRTIKAALDGLSKGSKNTLTLDTSKLEGSIADIRDAIVDLKKIFGSLDDGANFKPLLSSINQIANAFGKVENESDSLVKSLSALSKKDFSVNVGLKLGGNSVNNNSMYGDFVKDEVLPTLGKQEQELRKYLAKHFNTNEISALNKLSGSDLGGISGIITTLDKLNTPIKKGESLTDRMRDYKNFINTIISSANIQGIDLSPVLSQFDKLPNELIETANNIKNSVKETEDSFNKLKGIFGGSGIDADNLNIQLESIVSNLNEIKTTLQGLSSNNPLGEWTSSFDRLSGSIENLLKNAEKVKSVLGNSASNVGVDSNVGYSSTARIKSENIVPDSSEVVQSAQQVGMKIGYTIEQSVKQNINIDDIIDSEVLDLMETFSIAGDKGSNAFKEIRQALVECRSELQKLKNSDVGIDAEVFDTSRAFDKVSDAIANQMRAVNSLGDEYIKLAQYMKNFNDPKKGNKVRVPDFIKQEQGDDYKSTRGTLGIAFNTERGISFASFIEDLNHELGIAIDLTKGEERAYEELVHKLRLGKEQLKAQQKSQSSLQASASTDEILAQNYINKNEIRDIAGSSIDYINAAEAAEKAFAQASTQSTNTVVQSEERKQQAYRETAKEFLAIQKGEFKKIFDPADEGSGGIKNTAQSVEKHFKNLQGVIADTVSVQERFDADGNLQGFTVSLKNVNGEAEQLRYSFQAAAEGAKAFFKYTGGSVSDNGVIKQINAISAKADTLQNKLDKLKSEYSDPNASKPIKGSDHIAALSQQYERVEKAILGVRNADESTFASMVSNAEREKTALENMVREFRNAETLATSLRSKDIDTVGATYSSDLDVLISKMRKDGVYTSGFEKGAENLRSMLSEAVASKDKSGLISFLNGLDKLEAGYKRASAAKKEFNRSESVGIDTSRLESRIVNLQRIDPEINKFETKINNADVSVKSLLSDLGKIKTQDDFRVVNKRLSAFEKAAEAAGIKVKETATETNSDFNKLKSLAKEINSLEFKIAGLDANKNEAEIDALVVSLERLYEEYDKLFSATSMNLSGGQISQLDDIFAKAGDELRQLDAKIADTQAKLANGIKADIGLGNFENQVDEMYAKFNRLSDANTELRASVDLVTQAYNEMLLAASANTGDEVADRERLIEAEKKYAVALETTNNLIKIQARADNAEEAKRKLADSHKSLELDMVNWLKKNSKAAAEYGGQIDAIIASLNKLKQSGNLQQIDVNSARRQFNLLTKDAEQRGKTGLTVWGNIVEKVKEYSTYLSAAEIFMYAEQALRSMFEQVKLIDSAMVELKKVTDETDASYNNFLKNAGSRAKEIGTTIDGLVSSTADFARLGYGFEDAQGLAEVANIYAVVGDDIDGVEQATESLISTMAAFKNEMNGMNDVDFAMNIVDKFNEIGNNFAISSGGIGEALERSASSLMAANNTIDESIALITAANTVVVCATQHSNMFASR